jgi:hypothetical protein
MAIIVKKRIWLLVVVLLLLLSPTVLAADRWVYAAQSKATNSDWYYDQETLKGTPIREGDYFIDSWISQVYKRVDNRDDLPAITQARIFHLYHAKKMLVVRVVGYRSDNSVLYDIKYTDRNDWHPIPAGSVSEIVLEKLYLTLQTPKM